MSFLQTFQDVFWKHRERRWTVPANAPEIACHLHVSLATCQSVGVVPENMSHVWYHPLYVVVVVWSLSCVWLSGPQGQPDSSDYGISQARILEWVVIFSSRGSSWPRNRTHISCIWQAVSLPLSYQGSLSYMQWWGKEGSYCWVT